MGVKQLAWDGLDLTESSSAKSKQSTRWLDLDGETLFFLKREIVNIVTIWKIPYFTIFEVSFFFKQRTLAP